MVRMKTFIKTLFINMKSIGLPFILLAVLLTGCASGGGMMHQSEIDGALEGSGTKQSQVALISDTIKAFHVEILSQNSGICPGPDGKNMPFLGRDARIQVVLTFSTIPPAHLKPGQLSARLYHLNIPFTRRTGQNRFLTDVVDLNSLAPGLNMEARGVSIFYRTTDGEVLLGNGGRFAIDTTPPPKPLELQITTRGGTRRLTWKSQSDRIKEYRIQKWDAGRWLTFGSGFGSPPVTIDPATEARLRIVAVDCALNRSFSDDILVGEAENISITRIGRGKNRYMAYSGAQVLINDGFVREYVSPWLKSNTEFTDGEIRVFITERHEGWVPPGIEYTPESRVSYYLQDGKWCAEVTGTLNRVFFDDWAQKQLNDLKRR